MTTSAELSESIEDVIRLPSELPSGWEKSSLAEVAEIIMGQSPSSNYYNTEGSGLPFFQGKAEFGDLYPEAVKWCSAPGKIAQKDDVLISVRAPVGPTNLAPSECCIGRGLAAIYTDKPCDAPMLPGGEGPSNSTSGKATGQAVKQAKSIELDYSTPYGIWRGQAQYQGTTVKGQAMPEAHVVVPLVIEVEKQGRVRGASAENGCKLLGVAAPYVAPHMLKLDVTLSECRYPALNRRYSGTLALYQSSNSVQFSLRSLNPMVAVLIVGPSNFDIKATMKR